MFRPFLPCGIAYGFAYALPMALPMAFHALFPAEGIPPGCLYCTISARCLSTGFGRISAAFAFFRHRGCPRVGGDCSGVAGAAGVGGALRGTCLVCRLLTLPLAYFIAPYPPDPPSPAGKGETQSLFRRGLRPRHPCTEPLAALTDPAIQAPCEREPAARCKNGGNAFLWTMPAAKERGDRGRWNYPSQATAAFEMVLSPGAGIASAAWGQAPPAPRRVPQRQGQPMTSRASPPPARDTRPCSGAARVQPRGCKGRSPLHKKTKNLPLSRRGRALCERGSGGWGQNQS